MLILLLNKAQTNSCLSLLSYDFQTPENGATEKRPPVSKATPTPRPNANKNGSSAAAASKTAGTCTQFGFTSSSMPTVSLPESLISPECVIQTVVSDSVFDQTVAIATFSTTELELSTVARTMTHNGTTPGNRLTELLPYVALYQIQELLFLRHRTGIFICTSQTLSHLSKKGSYESTCDLLVEQTVYILQHPQRI